MERQRLTDHSAEHDIIVKEELAIKKSILELKTKDGQLDNKLKTFNDELDKLEGRVGGCVKRATATTQEIFELESRMEARMSELEKSFDRSVELLLDYLATKFDYFEEKTQENVNEYVENTLKYKNTIDELKKTDVSLDIQNKMIKDALGLPEDEEVKPFHRRLYNIKFKNNA